jgi:hypothetical protein
MKKKTRKRKLTLPSGKKCKVEAVDSPDYPELESMPDAMLDQILKTLTQPNKDGKSAIDLMFERKSDK